jgi:hypothetical protein
MADKGKEIAHIFFFSGEALRRRGIWVKRTVGLSNWPSMKVSYSYANSVQYANLSRTLYGKIISWKYKYLISQLNYLAPPTEKYKKNYSLKQRTFEFGIYNNPVSPSSGWG